MSQIGIGLCGGYVPIFRLERSAIAEIWGRRSIGGERSVANNDEDSATMAVEASLNCLKGVDKGGVDGLYFASTTMPYQEKSNAALVATAVDLRRDISIADFGNTLRAGTNALRAALDAVGSGSMSRVLVAASDMRQGYPRSDQEQSFGDGAAAVLVTQESAVAVLEDRYAVCNEMMDVWRNPEDTYVRTWEGRFILGEGYTSHVKEVVQGLLSKTGLAAKDIAKAVIPAPDLRTHKNVMSSLGFEGAQIQDNLLSNVGHCGAAHPLLMLTAALEEANPGDLILLAAYADGAEAMLFKVTDEIKKERQAKSVKEYMARKLTMPSYARFLSYKGLVETIPGEPFRLISSATVTWRDRASILRAHGSKCTACGTLSFPVQRVCNHCDAKDQFEETSIVDKEGEVFTFTRDNLAGRSDDPVVVQTVAELGEEKVRFYGMMTDCIPTEIQVGHPVGLTFRRIYDGAGMHNYFWKLRPLNIGGQE